MDRKVFAPMIVVLMTAFAFLAHADNPSLITGPIDTNDLVTSTSSAQPTPVGMGDLGPVPGDTSLAYQMIGLKLYRDPTKALNDLQNPTSSSYHQWLTPQEYGSQFGVSSEDIQKVSDWLQSYGLAVVQVANGRSFIVVSGTVSQLEAAFHAQVDYFYDGTTKFMGIKGNIQIPAALANVVEGPIFFPPSYPGGGGGGGARAVTVTAICSSWNCWIFRIESLVSSFGPLAWAGVGVAAILVGVLCVMIYKRRKAARS